MESVGWRRPESPGPELIAMAASRIQPVRKTEKRMRQITSVQDLFSTRGGGGLSTGSGLGWFGHEIFKYHYNSELVRKCF